MAIANQHIKSTSTTTALLVPEDKSYAITTILVCNNGESGSAYFDMHLVPNGQPVSNTDTRIINNLTLPFGETFTFDNEKIILNEGDSLVFFADPSTTYLAIPATALIVGKTYEIMTTGDTNFNLHGAIDSTPGTIFTATSVPSGTGTVRLSGYSSLTATVSYLEV
jgi:hypothetical protein